MRIDIKKLDERIKKLQEIRRIATDPELSTILLEFVGPDDEITAEQPVAKTGPVLEPSRDPVPSTRDLRKDVVNGTKSESRDGLWSRNR